MTDANDILMGGGVKSAKFENIGDSITGKVSKFEPRQQTDFDTGKPLFWESGEPRMQVVVTLETALRDPSDENDTGERNIYLKGKMLAAVRDAIRAAGGKGLELGANLTVTHTGTEPNTKNPKLKPTKLFGAVWVPAANAIMAADQPVAAPAVAPAPVQQAPAPVQQAPAQPPVADQAAAAAAIAALSPEQRKLLGLPV